MRRLDAALVAITIVMAAVWYSLRVAPSREDSAGTASPAPLARAAPVAPSARPPGSSPDVGGAGGGTTDALVADAIEVVHKHTLGSCRGRLSAPPAGLRYEPTRPGDGFDVPRAAVERFEADPRRKSLVVKLRGGRTYTFTDPQGRAERLQAFHKSFGKPRPRASAGP